MGRNEANGAGSTPGPYKVEPVPNHGRASGIVFKSIDHEFEQAGFARQVSISGILTKVPLHTKRPCVSDSHSVEPKRYGLSPGLDYAKPHCDRDIISRA